MVNSKDIHHEKKKIDKLAEFSEKVNRFINTKMTNKDNTKLLDVISKIHDKTMHDKKYLKNLDHRGPMTSSNSVLYNSPFMPGHTMAFDGKRSVPVANPLGTAALAMAANNANSLSLSLSATDQLDTKAKRLINSGPHPDDIPYMGMMPMAIDRRGSPEPMLMSPEPRLRHGRSLEPPIHLTAPPEPVMIGPSLVSNKNQFNRLGMSLGGLGAMPTADLPIVSSLGVSNLGMPVGITPTAPLAAPLGVASPMITPGPMPVASPMTFPTPTSGTTSFGFGPMAMPVPVSSLQNLAPSAPTGKGLIGGDKPYGTK